MFNLSTYLTVLNFFFLLIFVIVILISFNLLDFILKNRVRKKFIKESLKIRENKDIMNDFCNSIKSKSDKNFVTLVEKDHDEIIKEMLALNENFKLMLLGMFTGITSSITGTYIVYITLNGLDSLPKAALILFVVSITLLICFGRILFIKFQNRKTTIEMLNNPTMRNFMESLLIGSIEYQKKKEDVQQFKTIQKKR